ncbi:hypothetical protein SPI_07306 [Niveomyces insectorum RCEF 264]|uniref:Ca2+-modulated nonselective cation channel polycystin n=1 Tax=Niveomyces insectorum RCEF 264 TaxID=1081102 RepID=A0A167QHG3_9HYPO|nr:hypothetical protein SPI_07306 [Niveomyces insectorum RCEF 264]
MTESTQDPGRSHRRRPFTTWVRKLTHFKGGASAASGDAGQAAAGPKRHLTPKKIAPKKRASKNNNPYPLSGRLGVINDHHENDGQGDGDDEDGGPYYTTDNHRRHGRPHRSQPSFTSRSVITSSSTSLDGSRRSSSIDSTSDDGRAPPTAGERSVAATVSTDGDVRRSGLAASNGAASSITGTTSRTMNGERGSRRGGDSTFSSPAPSMQSLTTTLTTIQSLGPNSFMNGNGAQTIGGAAAAAGGGGGGGGLGNGGGSGAASVGGTSGVGITFNFANNSSSHTSHNNTNQHQQHHPHHHHNASQQSNGGGQTLHFHQPFPSTPASAIPLHLTPSGGTTGPSGGHPTTYSTATANNLLTDNASILTLASSSKRRRRRSLDTDASVRALAPSSLFGGSRESLPLSVLSATIEGGSIYGGVGGPGAGGGGSGSTPTTPGYPPPLPGQYTTGSSRMSVASGTGFVPTTTTATTTAGAGAERTSIYSATGGVFASERNSLYARQALSSSGVGGGAAAIGNGNGGDAASIRSGRSGRSGLLGHGRSESMTGSIGGSLTSPLGSPLASPRETAAEDVVMAATTVSTAQAATAATGETAASLETAAKPGVESTPLQASNGGDGKESKEEGG